MPNLHLYLLVTNAPGRLAITTHPRGGEWLIDNVVALRDHGYSVVVSLLTHAEQHELRLAEERDTFVAAGFEFISYPIEDRGVPTDPGSFRSLASGLARRLRIGESVLIHCRAGIGRSSMLAVATLTALGQSFDAAFAHVEEARERPVPDTDEQYAWMRANFGPGRNDETAALSARAALTPIPVNEGVAD